jgi:hypothetical protein
MVRLGYNIAGVPMSPLSSFVHFLSSFQQTVRYSSFRPRPIPSKSLPIHHASIILPSQTLRAPNDRPHKLPCTCAIKLGRSSTALFVRQRLVTQEPSSALWKMQERATCINRKTTRSVPYDRPQKNLSKNLNKARQITHRIMLFIVCIRSCIRNGTESRSRYCHGNAKTS